MTDPSGDRFVALFADAPIGIALLDSAGVIVSTNPALGTMLGVDPDAMAETTFAGYVSSKADLAAFEALLNSQTDGEPPGPTRLDTSLENAADGPVRSRLTLSTLPADEPGVSYPVVMVEDVNDLHLLHERLRHQNVHDSLTGLPNAANFHGKLESAMVDKSCATVALVLFDIDGFRVINDGLGSEAGDKILHAVATSMRDAFSGKDETVARLTGDGFGVLLRGDFGAQYVIDRVEHALDRLAEPVYLDDIGVGISASAGIVLCPPGSTSDVDMLRKAEVTLHRAKEAGRAKWMLFEPELDAEDRRRYRLAAGIAGGLERGEFELRYQPTVKLDGSRTVPVVNARLYWNHPTEGRLEYEDFIPLADVTGMTVRLGVWLLGEALGSYARWRAEAGEQLPDLCVRLPRRLAVDDDLVKIVRDQLTQHDVPSSALRLCADSATLVDPRGEVHDSLAVLGDLGVKLVLAVSAAADLDLIDRHQLPVGFVALNGRIIDELLDCPQTNTTGFEHLEHLVRSAKQLDVRIGAEGVRTDEQARALAELGVIAARGTFFRDPITADEMTEFITVGAG